MKTCNKCHNIKELDDFYKSDKYRGGYIHTCRSCFRQRNSSYRVQNKNKVKLDKAAWKSNNRRHVNEKQVEWRKNHQPSINQILANLLRNRLNKAVKANSKTGSAIRDLGCSIEELKVYLESKFQPGMTWENRGFRGWHIDHIEPLSKFDLTDLEQIRKACHYTNLQPMWASENISKGGA